MSYFFTIVVTVFDRLNLLPRSLFSVLSQDHDSWELVVVADGPHPAAELLVREFLDREPAYQDRISYLTAAHAPGCWGNVARRVGLDRARGRYTCFLGHDCLLTSAYLTAHAENIPAAEPVLSVVDVQYWRKRTKFGPGRELAVEVYDGLMPRRIRDLAHWDIGDLDLTCVAFPTAEAIRHGLFGPATAGAYPADALGFLALRKHLPVRHRLGVVAAHF